MQTTISKNIYAFQADGSSPEFAEFKKFHIDTIFSLNVLEHIEDDRATLINARHILQPGGRLILVVPAHKQLYGTMDRAIGHYRRYDKKMMGALLDSVGLKLEMSKYLNMPGAME